MADDKTFLGFHSWPNPCGEGGRGSFEVFYYSKGGQLELDLETGHYWQACFPGCLPDGEPMGPFPTAEGAYLDAIGD